MGFYSRHIFPRLCDWALDRPHVAKHRAQLLSCASGEILEIGFGTGLNLAHYPDAVRKITIVEPNAGMQRKAERRIDEAGISVDKRLLGGEELPFDDAAFDCVVSTFTLCSIEGVQQALAEVFRVLRPGGQFLFLEHGLSPDPGVRKWQRRLNWLEQLIGDNCRLDRDIQQLVASRPYQAVQIEHFYLEQTPRTHGYLSRGVATK